MSQLTETMVRGWLVKTDPDGAENNHIPSTVWEEHQLCRAWLALAASQREREQLQARLEAALRDIEERAALASQPAVADK